MADSEHVLPGAEHAGQAEQLLRQAQDDYDPAAVQQALDLLTYALDCLPEPPAQPEQTKASGIGADWATRLHRVRAVRLSNRSAAHVLRYGHHGVLEDLEAAIAARRAALAALPGADPREPVWRVRLAALLRMRFSATHLNSNLGEAIDTGRAAVQAPADTAARAEAQAELAVALRLHYEHDGDPASLDESIALARAAVAAAQRGTAQWGGYQSNLTVSLRDRFLLRRRVGDLNDAISAGRLAVAAPMAQRQRSGRLSNLAQALRSRHLLATNNFSRVVDTGDIDEAVELFREAFEHASPAQRGWRLADLAAALLSRYDAVRHDEDLRQGIDMARQAVSVPGASRYDLALRLNDLGYAVANGAAGWGKIELAREAVTVATRAVSLLTPGSANRAMFLEHLGLAYQVMFDISGDRQAWRSAITAWQRATEATASPTMDRVRAARRWAQFAERSAPGSKTALVAYVVALNLVPRLAWRGIDRDSQETVLQEVAALVPAAVACAVERGYLDTALELHEQGRAVLWSQLLHFRADMRDLAAREPQIAARLQFLADALAGRPIRLDADDAEMVSG
jgi:hypothetical protein